MLKTDLASATVPRPAPRVPLPRVATQPWDALRGLAAFGLCVSVLYFGAEVLIPTVVALFLSAMLEPVVAWMENRGITRKIAAPTLATLLTILIAWSGWATYSGIAGVAEQLPEYSSKIRARFHDIMGKANALEKSTQSLIPAVPEPRDVQKVQVVSSPIQAWSSAILTSMGSVFTLAGNLLLLPILVAFMLMERHHLETHLKRALGERFPLAEVAKEMSVMVKGYFISSLVLGLGTAVGFFLVFQYLGLAHPVMFSIFAGFTNLIPIFGPIIAALPALVQALIQFDGMNPLLIVFATSLVLHFAVVDVIVPKIVGARINVNATAATIGLLFWGCLWGVIGLLLAVPLVSLMRILLGAHPSTVRWADLLADTPHHSRRRIFGRRIIASRASP